MIDGQQRLTTIYLIYRFKNSESFGFIDEPRFTLYYETRDRSEDFLKSIDESRKDENNDYWFLCSIYHFLFGLSLRDGVINAMAIIPTIKTSMNPTNPRSTAPLLSQVLQ